MAPKNQEIIEMVLDIPAFIFHVSMTILIFTKLYKKDIQFSGGFYHLFALIAFIDIIGYLYTFITLRLTNVFGWLIEAFYCNKCPFNHVMARFTWNFAAYLVYFDFFAHSVVALNRFTAIKVPLLHEYIWKKNNLKLILLSLFLAPLLWLCLFQWMNASAHYEVFQNSTRIAAFFDEPIVQEFFLIRSATFCMLTAFITLSLDSYTIILYRRLFKYPFIQRNRHYHDIKLLIFSIIMFICQVFMMIWYMLGIIESVSDPPNKELTNLILVQYIWIIDVFSLGNSIVLFICSDLVRKSYVDFYNFKRFKKYIIPNQIHPREDIIT